MTPSAQNLNSKLSPRPRSGRLARGSVGDWRTGPIRLSSAPVRIVGAPSRYQGGYRVNC